MSEHDQRFLRERKQEIDERLTKIDRVLSRLARRNSAIFSQPLVSPDGEEIFPHTLDF